jgi:hypothetical protein
MKKGHPHARLKVAMGVALLTLCTLAGADPQSEPPAPEDAETAYTRVITERADKIVVSLSISDPEKARRVREMIARQYRDLRNIHDPRDATIRAARAGSGDKAAIDAEVAKIQEEAKAKLDVLHAEYLRRLQAELTSEQVDQVKDGMTYGVL